MRLTAYCLLLFPLALYSQDTAASGPTKVLTYHNDGTRSGANLHETTLTLSNVALGSFGKLFTNAVDAAVYAQPLYVPGLTIKGVQHNVVFIATENNTIYAFDADTAGPPLWKVNFNYGAAGVTVTPASSADVSCADLQPIIGITSTPVIDLSNYTIYAVAKTKEVSSSGTNFYHRLHGVNILSGKERFTQVNITASVPGSCGNVQNGSVVFDPLIQHQRAALLEVNHVIYAGFASHCDVGSYNGWLLGYNATSQAQVAVLNTTPDDTTGTCRGGIWQAGGGPSTDSQGNIYALTGNGGFNANTGGHSYGDSLLKLSPSGTGALSVADYFTPQNQDSLNDSDLDFAGSGTAVLVNDPGGPFPNLMVASGKAGTIYLVNRNKLGEYNGLNDNVVQSLPGAIGDGSSSYPPPVYFQNRMYFAASSDRLKGFQLSQGLFKTSPFATSSNTFGYLGAGLSLTAAPGGGNAIVWALEGTSNPGLLHAYNALTLAELYNSNMASGGVDSPGAAVKFSVPTISNGKVYVGTQNGVAVYGLLAH